MKPELKGPEQLALPAMEQLGPHTHRDLVPVREGGDGPRIGQICPGCYGIFDPVSGRPLRRGGVKWRAVVDQMKTDLIRANPNTPGPLGRLIRWLRAGTPETT